MQNMIRSLTWPDFEVSVDGSMIILITSQRKVFSFSSYLIWTGEVWLDAVKTTRRYLVSGQAILEKVKQSKVLVY